MEAMAVYPGSCGEIIQGKANGTDVLISCPVDIFTNVRVFECSSPHKRFKYQKSSALLKSVLKRWGYGELDDNFDIEIVSSIPKSKGFASSTADMCAVYICLLKLFNRNYDIVEAVEEFIKIEPTDSIIFRTMTMFDYRRGSLFKELGEYMSFYILAFEGQRIVDTVAFNNSSLPRLSDISDIIPFVKEAATSKDVSKLAYASTVSINRNLKRVPYEIIAEVERLKDMTGGLGIIGGHSGDVLGIIYDDRERLEYGMKFKDSIKGYRPHVLRTLRGDEYEGDYDYSSIKRQR